MQATHGRTTKPKRDPSGIQSVDNAVRVLLGVATASGPVSLRHLSTQIGMPPSNVHRYLHSLVANGLISHEGPSGKYDLGTLAVRLGLAALQRIDLINRTSDRLCELAEKVEASITLSVWTPRGPTIIRWEHRNHVIESLGVGSILPLPWSAAGMVFLTYLDEALTRSLIEQQLANVAAQPDINAIKAIVREKGYAITRGGVIDGFTGQAAPIFGWQNEIIGAVAIVAQICDPEVELERIPALLEFARSCSGSEIERQARDEPPTPTQRTVKREISSRR